VCVVYSGGFMKNYGLTHNNLDTDLIDLREKIVELENLEIERMQTGIPDWKIESKYRLFFDQVKEGILIVQDNKFKRVNSPLVQIVGYSVEEIIGTPFSNIVHSNELSRLNEIYNNRMAGKDAPVKYETVVKHKDGSDVPIEIRSGAVTYKEKTAVFAIIKRIAEDEKKLKCKQLSLDVGNAVSERKILIVDDDPVTLKILEKILLSEGYWVAKAANGKEALYIADDFLPDVIILDIMMPVMDGTIAVEYLEKNPRTKNIPVLFLTSIISKKEESRNLVANRRFLAKPIEKEKLLNEIERCLEKANKKDN